MDILRNMKPTAMPENKNFSSGPCAKRPGWNVTALNFGWRVSKKTTIDFKAYKVSARRDALGNLERISRADDGEDREETGWKPALPRLSARVATATKYDPIAHSVVSHT